MVTKNQTLKILKIYLFFEILLGLIFVVVPILILGIVFQVPFSISTTVGLILGVSALSGYCTLGAWVMKNGATN